MFEEKSEKEEKSGFDLIKNWFLNSPSHGIKRICRANSTFGRIFWSGTFLVFTILMSSFIYTVIMKYIAHPTKINLSVRQYRDPIHFPAITFCNLNPLRNDKVLQEGMNMQAQSIGPHPPSTDSQNQDRFTEYMCGLATENVNNKHPTIVKSGYKLNDLLIQCIFNGRACYRNFTSFFHPNYGNCYTFDNDEHVDNIRQNDISHFWSVDGDDTQDSYNLFLELFLYQNEYIPYLDDRAAFRIFIHRKHEIPILSQNSLFLAPTTFTKLIFSQRMISFSQQCRNDLTDDMKQTFNSNNVRYSQALCFKLCEFRFIERQCRCRDQLFMIFFQFFSQNQTNKIDTKNACSFKNKCLAKRHRFNSIKFCPECLPECEVIQYTIQSSYADYPNTRSIDKVLQRVEKHLKNTHYSAGQYNTSTCSNNRKEILLDDIVAVQISASPYATEILTESPMYTWVDLISSIGGQTGLWIGVSLISFVEFAELLFLLFCHFIKVIHQAIFNQWKSIHERYFVKKISTRF